MIRRIFHTILLITICAAPAFLSAQDTRLSVGRETNLPIPRYVSIKANEANMRVGPGSEYRIEWLYKRRSLPVKVIAESGQWRKVEDNEGYKGWIYYSLLSGRRTVIITAEKISLYDQASQASSLRAILEKNVIADLIQCSINWCQVQKDGYKGWLPKTAIWGVGDEEIIED